MNPSRREKVREILISKPFTSLEELEKLFPDVSSMTLRRDIEYYEKEGLVIKVRGGARCKRYIALSEEGTFFARASLYTEEKQRIARTAVNFIGSAETVFLDSGSTVAQMNHYLPKRDLTIYTADPTIALDLVEKENIELSLVGGKLSKKNLSVSGDAALHFVENHDIDIAFLSPAAFSLENGFSIGNPEEAAVKMAVVKKAKKVVFLLESHKIAQDLPCVFAKLFQADIIVTDVALSKPYVQACEKTGATLVVASK